MTLALVMLTGCLVAAVVDWALMTLRWARRS